MSMVIWATLYGMLLPRKRTHAANNKQLLISILYFVLCLVEVRV